MHRLLWKWLALERQHVLRPSDRLGRPISQAGDWIDERHGSGRRRAQERGGIDPSLAFHPHVGLLLAEASAFST
jgi:hypothetical protein